MSRSRCRDGRRRGSTAPTTPTRWICGSITRSRCRRPGRNTYDVTERGTLSETIAGHSQRYVLTDDKPYLLKPHQFILGRTLERVELPTDQGTPHLAARIEGKSSRARCGLMVHFTAPTVHPGWVGPLTLEMINLGPQTILLRPGMHIAQLIIEEVRGEIFLNPSQFHGQSTPEGLV